MGDASSAHTVASYERRWRQWQAFADHHGLVALPADPMHVAAFVVARLRAGVSPSGVAANLSAVGWFHTRLDPRRGGVVDAARSVARVLAKSGPARPLAPAPVLSVGALEAMVRVPAQMSRVRSARVVRLLSGAPPRRLSALRAEDVIFDVAGRWVDLVLPAVPASGTWPAVPAGTIRLEPGRTIVDCPVEAMRALVAAGPGDRPFDHKVLYGNKALQIDPFDPENAVGARLAARNRALVGVGYGGALRAEELSAARVENLEPVGDAYRLRLPRTKTSRDGRAEAVVLEATGGVLDPVALLDGWLAVRGDHDGPLFHTVHHHTDADRGLTTDEIRGTVRDLAVAVGLPKTVSAYSLRRSWATHTYLRDRDSIGRISLQLRHARIDTTMRYIEDLGTHLLDPDEVLSGDVVLAGPGGVTAPAKNLGFAPDPLDSLIGDAITALGAPAGLAPATVRQVAHYWSVWERWCTEHGFPPFPAEPSHVLLFAAHRAEEGVAPNTLRAQLKAIQRVHDDTGVATVGFTRIAAEIVGGLERGNAAARRQAPVISHGDLLRMAETARSHGETDLKALRDLVMLCVGYAG
ncbi:MAG: site-specific integrase, partial [Actinomycetota bacterium]|nr:site-specific integrase [Actinomycetota bacterium]